MWLRTEYDHRGNVVSARSVEDAEVERTIAHFDTTELAQIRLHLTSNASEVRFTREPE